MHEWKVGDLGVARDVEAIPTFEPGTIVRYEGHTNFGDSDFSTIGRWSVVFGPTEDGNLPRMEFFAFIDPLPEGDE